MILTDSDVDGSHIKALALICSTPSGRVCSANGFLSFMNTPILTAKRGNNVLKFYNNGEFETWPKTEIIRRGGRSNILKDWELQLG
jgi:DNA gyrase/topoisomerase IV subunit B